MNRFEIFEPVLEVELGIIGRDEGVDLVGLRVELGSSEFVVVDR